MRDRIKQTHLHPDIADISDGLARCGIQQAATDEVALSSCACAKAAARREDTSIILFS